MIRKWSKKWRVSAASGYGWKGIRAVASCRMNPHRPTAFPTRVFSGRPLEGKKKDSSLETVEGSQYMYLVSTMDPLPDPTPRRPRQA